MKKTQTALDLAGLVRQRDYGRFLAIQLAPRAARPVLYALSAFAGEMAQIPDHVSEPLAGFMRYAWWREALAEMQAGSPPRHHPLLLALAPWLANHSQAFALLDDLITAGQERLENPPDETPLQRSEMLLDQLWTLALGEPDALRVLNGFQLLKKEKSGRIRQVLSMIRYGLSN